MLVPRSSRYHQLPQLVASLLTFMFQNNLVLENCMSRGAKNQAYGSIIASGRNAATLHYVHNNQRYTGRQNVLIDAGCEYDTYASVCTILPLPLILIISSM